MSTLLFDALATPPTVPYQHPSRPFCGLAIVGEAPGADEVLHGRPFCGRSGKLLDRQLAEAGIDRSACLVANVFRIRPPDNDVGFFFRSTRSANGEALATHLGKFGSHWCLERYAGEIEALAEALRQANPSLILTVGRTPLWALTGRIDVSAARGQLLASRLGPWKVLPTYHPAYVARDRNGPVGQAFKADLAMAAATVLP